MMKEYKIFSNFTDMELTALEFNNKVQSINVIKLPSQVPSLLETLNFYSHTGAQDLIIINGDLDWLFRFCFAKSIFIKDRAKIIMVDIVLRKPSKLKIIDIIKSWYKRLLLKRVDHFIHYFKDLTEYSRHYGISPKRSSYVPFKVNFKSTDLKAIDTAKDYVYMAGRSMRDYKTFIEAARLTNLPTAFLNPVNSSKVYPWALNEKQIIQLGLECPRDFPPNLKVIENSTYEDTWLSALAKARIVVVATDSNNICASGISLYLEAMALKKPVILTKGPGADDVLTDQAIFVPPKKPSILAEAITTLWSDISLQEKLVSRGLVYTEKIGGVEELRVCIMASAISYLKKFSNY